MSVLHVLPRLGRPSSSWPAYAAAAWAVLFAARGVYWALGGTAGFGALSSGIREAAVAGDPVLFAALWLSVVLELFAAGLALALAGPGARAPGWLPGLGGRRMPDWALLTLACGAGTLLAGHGATFVVFGLLALAEPVRPTTELLWYLTVWGPWFLLGGTLFLIAAVGYRRRSTGARGPALAGSVAGGLGGLLVTGAPLAISALA